MASSLTRALPTLLACTQCNNQQVNHPALQDLTLDLLSTQSAPHHEVQSNTPPGGGPWRCTTPRSTTPHPSCGSFLATGPRGNCNQQRLRIDCTSRGCCWERTARCGCSCCSPALPGPRLSAASCLPHPPRHSQRNAQALCACAGCSKEGGKQRQLPHHHAAAVVAPCSRRRAARR